MIDKAKLELISYYIIKLLYQRSVKFPIDALQFPNAPFHMALMNAFSERLELNKVDDIPTSLGMANWFHGLDTAIGQSLYDAFAHILSEGVKKEITGLKISSTQQHTISRLMSDFSKGLRTPNLDEENKLIATSNMAPRIPVRNFTVDCYFEDESTIVAISFKVLKVTGNGLRMKKHQILSAKAALKNLYPQKRIYFYLGFPYDPFNENPVGFDKKKFFAFNRNLKKFYSADELLIGGELWDFISGSEKTMDQLLTVIKTIATPQFYENYKFISDRRNLEIKKTKYLDILKKWNLYSEISLIQNEKKLMEQIRYDKKALGVFRQPLFMRDGMYNRNRFDTLDAKFLQK